MTKNPEMPVSQLYEDAENTGSNDSANPTLGDIIATRLSRREVLKGALAVTAIKALLPPLDAWSASGAQTAIASATPSFTFQEVTAGSDERHHVAEGYDADILIRWGDRVLPGAPDFDPHNQTPEAQSQQFGYNNDYIGFIPHSGNGNRAFLAVNHEYTNVELMFPGGGALGRKNEFAGMTKTLVDIEMMAHGGTLLEIEKVDGKWRVVEASPYARRITADTPMRISGPASGNDRMKTKADPSGTQVRGMLNNCAGGVTPWGTWLSCEENFNGYFWNKEAAASAPDARPLRRYGAPGEWYAWGRHYERFDIAEEPNEPNRFGWVVEIDPKDPSSIPVKRTAMGRFKHEGAANIINKDGRFVVYQGDDERFDYVYKFVTKDKVDLETPGANRDILDRGTLYVARFNADGRGEWLPLVHGASPWLTEKFGFSNQGDVVIYARLAADLVGATKMDRPEDVEINPKTNKVYVMLTNNTRRTADQTDPANPRPNNAFGHIIEIIPQDGDHTSVSFGWEILVKCGDPAIAEVGATFNPATTRDGWFGMPDNAAVDALGRLWIATDGNEPAVTGRADGVWAMETEGPARGTSKLFFRCPNGAEMCGPELTPALDTFFLAVQHPGVAEDGQPMATFEAPSTRWPDFDPAMPPRPSVVAVTKKGGGKIAV